MYAMLSDGQTNPQL